jgi:hypothetical protein
MSRDRGLRVAKLPSVVLVPAYALALGLLGFLISHVWSAPLGAEHHCPGGVAPSACRYPADQSSWSMGWTVAGLLVGLVLGFATHAARSHRDR